MALGFYTTTATVLVLGALIPSVFGQGALVRPRSRGALNCGTLNIIPQKLTDDVPKDDCPHCLNAGGVEAVKSAAKHNWTVYDPVNTSIPFRRDGGLCGDPFRAKVPREHERGGKFGQSKLIPYTMEYVSGQVVEFVVELTTNHNGFFEFFICNVGECGGDISEKCFKEGHCHRLLREPNSDCDGEQSMSCAPIDEDYPGRWYVPCRINDDPINQKQFLGGEFMRYRLPENFVCDDCVIQWYYATANTCNPPGMYAFFDKHHMDKWRFCLGDATSLGGRQPMLEACGGRDNLVPEELWNCADVRVHRTDDDLPDAEPIKGLHVELPENATAIQNTVSTKCPPLNRTQMIVNCANFERLYPEKYFQAHHPANTAAGSQLQRTDSVQGAQPSWTKHTTSPEMGRDRQNSNVQPNSVLEFIIIT